MSVAVVSKMQNLTKELRLAMPAIKFYDATGLEQCKQSEIIVADFDLLTPHVYDLPNTKWVQGTWAGVDTIIPHIKQNIPLPFILTRFSGVHFGKIMSEYVLSNIVNHERNTRQTHLNQKTQNWNTDGKISNHRIISDLTIALLGVGTIGNFIGKTLHGLGAKILGMGRSPTMSSKLDRSHIEKYYTFQELPQLLKRCDYLINVLPHTEETKGLLNDDMLQNCKNVVFINIGRGSVINEAEIIKAIESRWISAAILDVFAVEPLPKESPLWTRPEITITPHVAGTSRAKDVAEQFKENYSLYLQNEPIPCCVKAGDTY